MSGTDDVVHVILQLTDAKGNSVSHMERKLLLEIDGPVKYLGVDNGWYRNTMAYSGKEIITHQGRTICIFQASDITGEAKITVTGEDLKASSKSIIIR